MKGFKKNKKLIPSKEEKAFLYQQVLELSPITALLSQNEAITVTLQKQKCKYTVIFTLGPGKWNIQIKEEGANLFDVCINAKNKAKKTMYYLMNQADTPIRNKQMAHFKKFPYLQ